MKEPAAIVRRITTSKKYDDKLVKALKQRQKLEDYHGAPVLVKYLPDCDEKGAMDPRLYRDQKMALMMAWMPSFLTKMIGMFAGMTVGLEPILGTRDMENDYLNPYTREPADNPPTLSTKWYPSFWPTVRDNSVGLETRFPILYFCSFVALGMQTYFLLHDPIRKRIPGEKRG